MLRQLIGRVPPAYRMLNRLRGYRLNDPDIRLPHSVLGSWYGGWAVPDDCLSKTSVVYSFGVGEDITFDLALIAKSGCKVHAFDPTPIASKWISTQNLPPEFEFHNVGLADMDGYSSFFIPDSSHSFSMQSASKGAGRIECPVRRLSSLMGELGHDHIDLLKMDIEGFEYGVIADFVQEGIRPRILNVEFHHKSYGVRKERTRTAVQLLRDAGYRIFWMSDVGREYGFILV